MDRQAIETVEMTLENLVEALLFVSTMRVTPAQLGEALEKPSQEIEDALRCLQERYTQGSGLRIQWHGGRVQLVTAAEIAPLIERFLGLEVTSRLSRAALESLSIIAYKQPVTKPSIDAIRGVNSDGVVKSLLSKGLIEELGRSEGPGRPILYGTTEDFLHYFGLQSIAELPPLEEQPANGSNPVLKD